MIFDIMSWHTLMDSFQICLESWLKKKTNSAKWIFLSLEVDSLRSQNKNIY